MPLQASAKSLLVTLTLLSLFVSSSQSWAFSIAPEAQAVENTEPTESNTASTKASSKPQETSDKNNPALEGKTNKKSEKENEDAALTNTAEPNKNNRLIKAPTDEFIQQQQDIQHYLSQENIVPLMVGEEQYLTAINEHTTAINKGVMLLVPDWQQSIATPNALNQLQKNMPDHGWTTITLHPPHKPKDYPSQALTIEERNTQNIDSLKKYNKKFAEIMSALIEKAKNYSGVIIIVAEGSHAELIVEISQQGLVSAPSAMVMLSSYMPTTPESNQIAQILAMTDYPVFDLYLQRDHPLVIANAKIRSDFAKREMKIYYRQKQLNNRTTGYYPKNTLTREIIGWLSSIGW
ncbi:MAG: DUF3530 family protein [Cognaticolwellia sp.]